MPIPFFQVDAFSEVPFEGNPAAVCILNEWLDDTVLQQIASENNLSETAFTIVRDEDCALRWFTPATEVKLCGHATLATAHILFSQGFCTSDRLDFSTRWSGRLQVQRFGGDYVMDFPAAPPRPVPVPSGLSGALGTNRILETHADDDLLVLLESEEAVAALAPDFTALSRLDYRGIIVTAPSDSYDFVSRFFGPRVGVNEDPVTGSAHCILAPFWSDRLGKTRLNAHQISTRGGTLECALSGDRVQLRGHAITVISGSLQL